MTVPTRLDTLVERAQTLIDEIGDQAERDRQSYNAGYRDAMAFCRVMFDHVLDVGRDQGREEDRHAWAEAVAPVQAQHRAAGYRTRAELDALRYPDHTPEQLAELRAAARRRYGLPLGQNS